MQIHIANIHEYNSDSQGGCSDLSSIVAEAQKKIMQTSKQIVRHTGHLVALTGTDLNFTVENKDDTSNSKVKLNLKYVKAPKQHLFKDYSRKL